MAVYTTVTQPQLKAFLKNYRLGQLVGFEGIKDGIDNSNYVVTTIQGNYILTLFEKLPPEQIQDYLKLLLYLKKHNITCPNPIANNRSDLLALLNKKPAVLFSFLNGAAVTEPGIEHYQAIGELLAKMHLSTQNYTFPIQNNHDLNWCKHTFSKIQKQLGKDDCNILEDEINFQIAYQCPALPNGIIHGDLFQDNVFFQDNKISGILDFYDACTDVYLLDIAITINDWCLEKKQINAEKVNNLLSSYEKIRPLSEFEKQNMTAFLRLAALRFWLSRLSHQLSPRNGELTQTKNPLVFKKILLQHRQ